jgi:hypothetical protein
MAKLRVKAKARGRSRVTSLKPAITLTEAMANPDLFGKVFASPSFWTWKVVAKLIDGIPLTEKREIDLLVRAVHGDESAPARTCRQPGARRGPAQGSRGILELLAR